MGIEFLDKPVKDPFSLSLLEVRWIHSTLGHEGQTPQSESHKAAETFWRKSILVTENNLLRLA